MMVSCMCTNVWAFCGPLCAFFGAIFSSSWPIFGLIAGQGSLASVSNYIFWLRNGNLVFELATSTLNIFIGSFVRTTTYSKMITSLYSSGSHWAGRTPPNPIRSASLAAVAAAAQRIQMLSGSAAKDFLAKSWQVWREAKSGASLPLSAAPGNSFFLRTTTMNRWHRWGPIGYQFIGQRRRRQPGGGRESSTEVFTGKTILGTNTSSQFLSNFDTPRHS